MRARMPPPQYDRRMSTAGTGDSLPYEILQFNSTILNRIPVTDMIGLKHCLELHGKLLLGVYRWLLSTGMYKLYSFLKSENLVVKNWK